MLAIVGGSDRRASGSCLAPDVRTWIASPEQGRAAAVGSTHGADNARQALARLAPSSLTVVGVAHADDACWAEIERVGDGRQETCIVGLRCDDAGAVSRLVWLRAALVPARDPGDRNAAPDARTVLGRYFADLMSSRFREAASHFSADTIYSHPPYAGGSERVLYCGREALLRGWVTDRGPSPAQQIITGLWQRGSRVFVEGVIEGIAGGGSFFSTAQLTADGEIARYVAFYSATRIPGLNQESN